MDDSMAKEAHNTGWPFKRMKQDRNATIFAEMSYGFASYMEIMATEWAKGKWKMGQWNTWTSHVFIPDWATI
jgi:hypothetical protein